MSESGSDGSGDAEESSGLDATDVRGLGGEQFASILSAAWTNRGWETDVAESDGEYLVTGDQGGGQRGLILVVPGTGDISGQRVQQYVTLVEEKAVDVRVVATQGAFSDDAARIASANDVHLLDAQAVLETVEAEGLEGTLAEYAGDGGGVGSLFGGLPLPVPSIPGGVSLPNPGGSGLRSALVVVLIATSLLSGFAGGAFLDPGTGGAEDGGVLASVLEIGGFAGEDDDVAVAALSTAATDEAGLTVRWNARPVDSVVANGTTYEAPNGTRFLVVQLAITNTGEERVPVRGGDIAVHVDGARYTNQPLEGARTFEPTATEPGDSATGWLVFTIPETTTDAVLVPNPEAAGGPMAFSHDSELAVNGTA